MSKDNSICAEQCSEEGRPFLAQGLEGMSGREVLERLLPYAIPQGDASQLAQALMDRFGSLRGVFQASYDQLRSVKGIGENAATLFQLILSVMARALEQEIDSKEVYEHTSQFKKLLQGHFVGARNEKVYLVCLDGQKRCLVRRKLAEGIADTVPITTRTIMETALACGAPTVVLAHNHVSGVAAPSLEDISATRTLMNSLLQIRIELYDHLVFGGGDVTSMRETGVLEQFKREAERASFPMIWR